MVDASAALTTRDAPATAMLRVRNVPTHALDTLGESLGVRWPHAPNSCARGNDVEVCWLGPREWAVIGLSGVALAQAVTPNLGLAHVADVTDAWTRWRIRGAGALDVLAKGCSLDLDAFDQTCCARTLLGQVAILLIKQPDAWAIHAERALSEHLGQWFAQAGVYLHVAVGATTP
jgi:heterotetrameric sarcosine oxidase gamma subunit